MLSHKFQEYLQLSAQLRPHYIASLGPGTNHESGNARTQITTILPDAPELLRGIYSTVAGTSSEEEDPTLVEFIPGYRLIHIDEYAQEMKVLTGILEEKKQNTDGIVLPLLTN